MADGLMASIQKMMKGGGGLERRGGKRRTGKRRGGKRRTGKRRTGKRRTGKHGRRRRTQRLFGGGVDGLQRRS